jgi:hypothetical protein
MVDFLCAVLMNTLKRMCTEGFLIDKFKHYAELQRHN